ncbi:zinc finger BED domain-containing protein DAYSLEEPER-like [Lotus japonicus]|uniref:zinc finger BED domain-containing protein DAYSLEEPER-like n=1 Tax=Lotus japonicus TaxID=34305 RepID=UPI00258B33CF|nr:zinc finger BED domain-containing protein DAYSLEEPER-like [Lotus japonicus]
MECPDSDAQPNWRSRKKSGVWEHFTVKSDESGCSKAYCKSCKKPFAYINGSKQSGTSHLRRHISLGICQKNQQTLCSKTGADPPKKKRARAKVAAISFDQERCNDKIAKMIILHDYPLHIVEHRGFIDFARALQPQFNPLSLNAVQEDCVAIYLRKKQNLLKLIDGIPGRVNLTLDLWTSDQTSAYVFLRGHFVDCDWNLHHPILSVLKMPFPDSGGSLNQSINTCLHDWHLEGRIFTLVLDKFFFSETLIGNLRGLFSIKNPEILNGQLLSQNCYSRVLTRLASDALWAMRETIDKVRKSVKYVKSSESREQKFLKLRQKLQLSSKSNLLIDDQTKWDTVYHMLVAACELKQIFCCFGVGDPDCRMTLKLDDWKQVEILCTYLKCLYDAANILTVQPYPTANLFFPVVSKLQVEFTHASLSQDAFCRNLIMPLQEKFDQYWRENCFVLAIAAAMDPRYKMKIVESTFANIYGENAELWIRIVENGLHEIFLEYNSVDVLSLTPSNGDEGDESITMKTDPFQKGSLETKPFQFQSGSFEIEPFPEGSFDFDGSPFDAEDGLPDIEFYISDFISNPSFKSELSEYLEEPLEPRVPDFDILRWWRINALKYPTLSRMASDILSISASTLPASSVFDTEIRKMDSYRSSLDSPTLEALICTKDWFRYESLPINVSNDLVKVEY